MKIYVEAKSKADLIRRLATGEEISGYNYSIFGGGGHYMLDDTLEDGTIIAIYSQMSQGSPVAKSWGTWTNKVLKAESFSAEETELVYDESDEKVWVVKENGDRIGEIRLYYGRGWHNLSPYHPSLVYDTSPQRGKRRKWVFEITYPSDRDGETKSFDAWDFQTINQARKAFMDFWNGLPDRTQYAESFSAEGGNREEQKWITTGVDFQWGNDEPVQPPSGFLVLLKCSGCGYEHTVPTSYNAIGCPDCEATMTGFEAGLLPSFRTNLDAESFSAENRCSVCGDLAVHLLKKGEIVLCDKHYQQQFGKYSAETFESPVSCKICGKTFDSFRGLNGHMNAHIPSHRKRAESFAAENTSVKKFPTLYKKDSANRIRIWDISVEKDSTGDYIIQTSSGLEGGKIKRDAGVKITAGKVTRTPKEQALAQANSKWVHKLDTGYYDTKLDASGSKRVTPMLAKPFDKHGHKIQYPAVAQRKFDGVRCLARNVPDSGFSHDVSLVSRTNREWLDLDHIRQQVAALKIPDNIILDGEIYAHHLTFNRLNGLTKKQKLTEVDKKDLASTNLRVYDCIDIDNPHWKYINRWRYLKKILTANPQSNLILTKNYRIDKPEDIGALHDRFVEEKYEGLIMRNINSPYEQKRSFHLQKVKSFVDEEYTIVGFKEGVGKNEGTPVWICETEQGFTFGAAPKGTKAEREEMWRDREEYVGKELTVKHFPPADKETGIPRLPIGKGVRSEADLPPKEAEFFDSQEENDADKMVGLSKKRTWMSAARTIMAATTLALGYMIYRNQMEGKR